MYWERLGFSTLRMMRWRCPCPSRTETPQSTSCLGGEERIGPSSLDPLIGVCPEDVDDIDDDDDGDNDGDDQNGDYA